MKALSIKEPWASMIQSGKKTIETRTWKTTYTGNILLCASKNPKSAISGHAFAVAEIIACSKMHIEHIEKACCDVYDGAYSWFLYNIRPLQSVFPVKGKLSLFEVDIEPDNLELMERVDV